MRSAGLDRRNLLGDAVDSASARVELGGVHGHDLAAWVRSSAADLMGADATTARSLQDTLISDRPIG